MGGPRSIVLITVDCMRADHVGFLGYARPTTPFLDSLAGESLVFPAAIVGGAPTYFSFPSILAARHPLALGRDILGLSPSEPTLASVLREAGYTTAAFNAGNPYLSRRFGYDTGFDHFQDFLEFDESQSKASPDSGDAPLRTRLNRRLNQLCHKSSVLGRTYDQLYFQYCQRIAISPLSSVGTLRRFPSADFIVDRAEEWLSTVSKPFFLWLHLMDPHSPYYPAPQALRWMGEERMTPTHIRYLNSYWNRSDLGTRQLRSHRDEIVALYDAGIRWVDEQLGVLVEALRRLDRWEDCVFAVTSDHGEQFLEHGGRYHAPSSVTEELIRVPLLLRVPGVSQGFMTGQPFSLIHLAPTLLGSVNVAVAEGFAGRNFWPEVLRNEGWDETAVVESIAQCANPFRHEERLGPRVLVVREIRYKLVIDFEAHREDLFDLRADPSEQHPLPKNVQGPVRRRLLEKARAHLAQNKCHDSSLRMSARLQELRHDWPGVGHGTAADGLTPAENVTVLSATGS